jgi:hypothetical protein
MEDTMDCYTLNDPTFLAMCYKAINLLSAQIKQEMQRENTTINFYFFYSASQAEQGDHSEAIEQNINTLPKRDLQDFPSAPPPPNVAL